MEEGTPVWIRDLNESWVTGKVVRKGDIKGKRSITITKDQSKEEVNFGIQGDEQETDDIKLVNKPEEAEFDDLIKLPYLNEPSILNCLQTRYLSNKIYTYTGPILIAVNPFKELKIYDQDTLEAYFNFGVMRAEGTLEHMCVGNLAPHIFAVSDNAYRNMMEVIKRDPPGKKVNPLSFPAGQSILISGESGAGKTESTKILLRYLTTAALDSYDYATTGTYMEKVMQSNPILEAFGNARTVRNDNSSRFGKFVLINFNNRGRLIGGYISTYLLEKVRLCYQQAGERNYHIFYQMAAGGSAEEKKRWSLQSIKTFDYCNQGCVFELEHINDAKEFTATRTAFKTLDFDAASQVELLDVVAALLHLGQIKFVPDADEGSELSKDSSTQTSLKVSAQLCGVASADFHRAMTERASATGKEIFIRKLKPAQAADARDALAKAIYSKMFDWMVSNINLQLRPDDPSAVRADIGVLDIFGFECFQNNSFEQLCINYTNETLQQQFNKYVFELEQIEYKQEEIEWSFVEFPNNQDCLDLIEMKKVGIFAMIDDECRIPKGSDMNLAKRMYDSFKENKRFAVSAVQKTSGDFAINHYAGPVVYSTQKFVEKNKDELPKEANELFGKSSSKLLRLLFAVAQSGSSKAAATAAVTLNPSVCFQFKEQLSSLVLKIQSTQPHYVRCIKPNDQNKPDIMHRLRTTEQLRCGGVLEAVRVARSGFPYRMTFEDFFSRYRAQANPFGTQYSKLPNTLKGQTKLSQLCQSLVPCLWDDLSAPKVGSSRIILRKHAFLLKWKGKTTSDGISRDAIQIGTTKVFFRKPPHDLLEGRRNRLTFFSASRIQAVVRGFMVRVVGIKRAKRVFFAAVRIQKNYRAHYYADRLNRIRLGVIYLQASFRGMDTRANVRKILEEDERYMSRFKNAGGAAKKPVKKVKVVHTEAQKAEKIEKIEKIQDIKEKKAGKLSKLFNRITEEQTLLYRARIPKLWNKDRVLKLFGVDSMGLKPIF